MQIKNLEVYGLNESIIRSQYPMKVGEPISLEFINSEDLTTNRIKRACQLSNAPNGSGHSNFLKGIIIQFDLCYPEYFSPQLQRYHWVDIISSQSKMHKITSRSLTLDDFTDSTDPDFIAAINDYIDSYNLVDSKEEKSHYFNKIISNIPSGYLKWMGISTNYLQLKTIYSQRRHHKLDEWQYFCDFIETLPMSNLITGKTNE